MSNYTLLQLKILAITPKITAGISIPCDLFIIKEVLRDYKRKRAKPVDRALLGMSAIDFFASTGWFMSTWLVPRGSQNTIYAVGNTQTCTYQGFLLQFAIGAPLYNCSLALYCLLAIKYKWTNENIIKIEPWIHGGIMAFSSVTAVAGVILQLFNQVTSVCWINEHPQGCNSGSSDIACERGNNAWIYGLLWFYCPLWLCIMLTLAALVLICQHVRRTFQQSQRHDFVSQLRKRKSFKNRIQAARNKPFLNTNDVAKQAILYSICFFITWAPSTTWSIMGWFNSPKFWLDFFSSFFEPLQGFMNFLIFIRPRKDIRARLYRDFCKIFPLGGESQANDCFSNFSEVSGDDQQTANKAKDNNSVQEESQETGVADDLNTP